MFNGLRWEREKLDYGKNCPIIDLIKNQTIPSSGILMAKEPAIES
jgi:hypothetical protein